MTWKNTLRKAPYDSMEYNEQLNTESASSKQKQLDMIDGLAEKFLDDDFKAQQRKNPNRSYYELRAETKKFIDPLTLLSYKEIEDNLKELYTRGITKVEEVNIVTTLGGFKIRFSLKNIKQASNAINERQKQVRR